MKDKLLKFAKNNKILTALSVLVLSVILFALTQTYMRANSIPPVEEKIENNTYKTAYFAGGCFWCTETEFDHTDGVIESYSGYAEVDEAKLTREFPSYEEVGSGKIYAVEAVKVVYDPNIISYRALIAVYFKHIDPTDDGGQFADRGHQYKPIIYTQSDEEVAVSREIIDNINKSKLFEDETVKVEVKEFKNFYLAEEYHQDYKKKNPLRYSVYREGSGRDSFIRLHWKDIGEEKHDEIFGKNLGGAIEDSKYMLTKEEKEKRIKELSEISRHVTQEEGTERPFENEYNDNKEKGIYVDIVSGEPLFLSSDKYDSGTGWPSFVKPVSEENITLKEDRKLWSTRIEVRSKFADSHLGHVFPDGPKDRGGMRYCMNSASMKFIPLEKMSEEGYGEYVNLVK